MREEVERIFNQINLEDYKNLSTRKMIKKIRQDYNLDKNSPVIDFVCIKIMLADMN